MNDICTEEMMCRYGVGRANSLASSLSTLNRTVNFASRLRKGTKIVGNEATSCRLDARSEIENAGRQGEAMRHLAGNDPIRIPSNSVCVPLSSPRVNHNYNASRRKVMTFSFFIRYLINSF